MNPEESKIQFSRKWPIVRMNKENGNPDYIPK